MPRARVTAARLAQVVCDSSGTRHARRRTYGGDPQLELVTIEAVEHRKIGHPSARAEICWGIVEGIAACHLGPTHVAAPAGHLSPTRGAHLKGWPFMSKKPATRPANPCFSSGPCA